MRVESAAETSRQTTDATPTVQPPEVTTSVGHIFGLPSTFTDPLHLLVLIIGVSKLSLISALISPFSYFASFHSFTRLCVLLSFGLLLCTCHLFLQVFCAGTCLAVLAYIFLD